MLEFTVGKLGKESFFSTLQKSCKEPSFKLHPKWSEDPWTFCRIKNVQNIIRPGDLKVVDGRGSVTI